MSARGEFIGLFVSSISPPYVWFSLTLLGLGLSPSGETLRAAVADPRPRRSFVAHPSSRDLSWEL